MNKSKVTITIDPYILEEAKRMNLNISETTELALNRRLNPANVELPKEKQAYPFEVCTDRLPEVFRDRIFGMCGIKAKRCSKCNRVFFVNDLHDEFRLCSSCAELNIINDIDSRPDTP